MKKLLYSLLVFLILCDKGKESVISPKLQEAEDWMGVYIGSQKIGYVYSSMKKTDSSFLFNQKTKMKLLLLGSEETFSSNFKTETDYSFNLKSFSFDIVSRRHNFYAEGKREKDKLRFLIRTANKIFQKELEIKETLIPPVALGYYIRALNMKPGEKMKIKVLEPTILSIVDAEIEVKKKEEIEVNNKKYNTLHLILNMLGMEREVWIDSIGSSVKELQQPDITMFRESAEEALKLESEVAKLDLLSYFSIKVDTIIENPRELKYLKLELTGIKDFGDLAVESQFQKVTKKNEGFIIEIKKPNLKEMKDRVIYSPQAQKYLEPSIYIQCDDPKIKNKAIEITKGAKTPLEKVKKIIDWLYFHIKKKTTASVPSAVEVLETKEGDCNEHAILFAALARASGIPTKITVGVVYLNRAFHYHAWNKVYIDGKWIPVDPTFGELPANPTHVQFNEGDLAEQAKVLNIVGKINFDKLEFN